MAKLPDPLPACPLCEADETAVTEDVNDTVTVLVCGACQRTWAVRAD